MSRFHRWFVKAARTAHLYLTLFGLGFILFFAVTGFMLNHEEWFRIGEPATWERDGAIPKRLLDPVDELGIVEALRRDFGTTGSVDKEKGGFKVPEHAEDPIEVVFSRPGGRAVAQVWRDNGRVHVDYEASGWAGVMTDLHKGKSAGDPWRLAIDAVCILLVSVSMTGLVLWWSLKGRGKWGTVALVVGTAAGFAIYYWGVP